MIFSGTLNPNVDPSYLLSMLDDPICNAIHVHFYAAKTPMREKVERSGIVGVECYDWVLPSKLVKLQLSADALISIAECEGKQISSKIYEYMSLGKPVMHLYTCDNDVNLKYLVNYPFALCLKCDAKELLHNRWRMILWLAWVKGRRVSFEKAVKKSKGAYSVLRYEPDNGGAQCRAQLAAMLKDVLALLRILKTLITDLFCRRSRFRSLLPL